MIEKLIDFDVEDLRDKINEIIGKMETFEANLLSMSRILNGLLNRQGKDNIEVKPNVQMSQPAVCEHYYGWDNLSPRCYHCRKIRGEA